MANRGRASAAHEHEADQQGSDAPARERTPEGVLGLQRRAGNRATSQLLSVAQPKLRVGPSGDRYEREADSVASQVVSALQRPDIAEQPVGRTVQRRNAPPSGAQVGAEGGELPGGVEADIQAARSGGAPLDADTRQQMEGAFGTDFGAVRLHADGRSAAMNASIQARAFTVGSDIFFDGRAPDPRTRDGQELLAHELTHTIQQSGGAPAVQRWSLFGDKKDKKPNVQEVAKKQEVVEKKRLKGEKEIGTKQRDQMKEEIGNDPEAQTKLRERFDEALGKEAALRDKLIKGGMDPEKAETQAYETIWLKAEPELRAIRPMRETRAEKLVSKTTEMRTEQSSLKTSKEGVLESRGSLVSKAVEELFVKEVRLIHEMLKLKVPLEEAKQEAFEMVWLKADPKVVAKRPPMGSKLEKAAYELAEKRAGLPDFEKEESGSVLDTIGTVGKGAMAGTGGIGKGVNKLFDDKNKKTLSTGEMAGGGMDSISSMISGVLDSVVGIKDFVQYVSQLTSQKSVDFNDVGQAIKMGLGELGKLNSNARTAMRIAQSLSESALSSLASAMPIVDVIGNAIAIAGGIAEAVPNAMRYGSNLGDIYLARAGERPELVLPLQRLGQRNMQLLENSLYKTASATTKMTLAIAQLASAGGDFGASTALKGVVMGIDAAHAFGHLVADNVFAVQAKDARKGLIARGEGSAETLLRRDAGYAVDALIAAALSGDKKTQWLARGALKDSYGIEFTTGDPGEIAAAHERVLKILQESDDPKTTLDKLKDGVEKVKSKAGAMLDKAADVGTLAKARNAEDGKNRGFGWKMKMWFKSEGALARRIAQHNVEQGADLESNKQKKGAKYKSKGEDPNITRPKVQQALIDEMDGMTVEELQAAANDKTRSQFERIVFAQAAAEKLKLEMQK